MAEASTSITLGARAPDFSLRSAQSKRRFALEDFSGARALLVAFVCNHCPFVRHIEHELGRVAVRYEPKGLATVAISANDGEAYPEDGIGGMAEQVARAKWPFPYLYDETQKVARAYGAVCTPDLFLYDSEQRLAYRGQFDDARPGNGAQVTGESLRAAIECVLTSSPVPEPHKPSVGCGIKWKTGNEPV